MTGAKSDLGFFLKVGKLKQTGRRGWNLRGIEMPETVADHSFRTALMALHYGKKLGLDAGKLVALALIHDLNEAETGEQSTSDKFKRISESEKMRKGADAMKRTLSDLPPAAQKEYVSLWKEENSRGSREGSFARDLNKVELAIQALEYELAGHPRERLEDMWEHARSSIKDSRIKALLREAERMRPREKKLF